MERTSEKIFFSNSRGQKLAAVLDRPVTAPSTFGVFGPCFTCVKESHAASKICRALAERGIGMLRIDTTGFGESEGDPRLTNISTRIDDLQSAGKWLADNHTSPRLLIGHSMSGTAALSAVIGMPTIDLLMTIGSPRDPQTTLARFERDGLITTQSDGTLNINVLGRPHIFDHSFLDDLRASRVAQDTALFKGTLLAAHAVSDEIVEYAEAKAIVERASSAAKAEVITLPDEAGHLFLKGNAAAEWLADEITKRL